MSGRGARGANEEVPPTLKSTTPCYSRGGMETETNEPRHRFERLVVVGLEAERS